MNGDSIISGISAQTETGKSRENVMYAGSSSLLSQLPPVSNPTENKTETKKKPAIRHAEKRRTSTCRFADRVAQLSVDHYKATIPIEKRPPQTCIATIIAHYRKNEDDHKTKDNDQNSIDDKKYCSDAEGQMMWVLSMGVGTKFLSESCLREELENEVKDGYGSRVRDMHAEVLARRAFRRQLTLEIQEDQRVLETNRRASDRFGDNDNKQGENPSVLVRSNGLSSRKRTDKCPKIRYKLRPGLTLHMYTSSAPCGNATLKKFCKMSKERFRDDLGSDEWPTTPHEPPPGHSIKLGEFSLLVKKDNYQTSQRKSINNENSSKVGIDSKEGTTGAPRSSSTGPDGDLATTRKRMRNENEKSSNQITRASENSLKQHKSQTRRGKPWPATLSDDWAPPGTTIVGFRHKGSIHTCSDKICRWNYLGLQGSLLAGLLEEPLYLSSLTVGRKLSGSVCRRAICCRLDTRCHQPKIKSLSGHSDIDGIGDAIEYRVNHPAVMGTSVYLDTGVVDTSNVDERGQDVRFHSSFVWSWWLGLNKDTGDDGVLECIESSSGYLARNSDEYQNNLNSNIGEVHDIAPKVSTIELTSLFLQLYHEPTAKGSSKIPCDLLLFTNIDKINNAGEENCQHNKKSHLKNTLGDIREIKKRYSPKHETFKDLLLTEHKVLSQWRRRENSSRCNKCPDSI